MKLFAGLLFLVILFASICVVLVEAFDEYCCMAVRRTKR